MYMQYGLNVFERLTVHKTLTIPSNFGQVLVNGCEQSYSAEHYKYLLDKMYEQACPPGSCMFNMGPI